MIVGVIIGEYVPTVQEAFDTARFDGVSIRASKLYLLLNLLNNPKIQQSS
jgi:ACR3 family arsenite efflux pump ArsB